MSNPIFEITNTFYKLDANDRKEVVAELLKEFVNRASRDEIKELATDLSHTHRTHVQSMFGLFLQFSKVLAANREAGFFDARNEYACETAAKIMKLTNDQSVCPFI